MRVTGLALAMTVALGTWGAAPAEAQQKLDSFAGSCSVQGSASFDPPVTNNDSELNVAYRGNGTCSGTLDGQKVSSMPVQFAHTAHSRGSCLGAATTGPGQGSITFADGTTIRYAVEFAFELTEGDFSFGGKRSGSASGHGSFLTPRTPPDVGLQCAGEGARELPLDISLTTQTPLVSERNGGRSPKHRRRHHHRRHRHHHHRRHHHPQQPASGGGAETLQGSCDFDGTVRFDPPLRISSGPTSVVAEGPGQCSGTLTDAAGQNHQLDQAPALYHAVSAGAQSCGSNPGSTGAGFLAVGTARIDFSLSETRLGPLASLTLEGQAGGSFSATATSSGDPLEAGMACAGPGLSRDRLRISGSTNPAISG